MNAPAACVRPAHVLVLSRRAESVPRARRAVADGLLGVVTDTGARDDTLLVLSELLGNAVRHAIALSTDESGHDESPDDESPDAVEVRWQVLPGALEVTVVDGGGGEPYLATRGDDAVTGRGMAVVEALSEAWGTTLLGSGRRAVWARIPLSA